MRDSTESLLTPNKLVKCKPTVQTEGKADD